MLVAIVATTSPLTVRVLPSQVVETALNNYSGSLSVSDPVYVLRRADTGAPVVMGKVA